MIRITRDPLDAAAIVAGPTRLVVAATAVDTGAAVWFEPDAAAMAQVLQASSAVPVAPSSRAT